MSHLDSSRKTCQIFERATPTSPVSISECLLYFSLSSCLRQLKIPKIWRRALVVAIPKPKNPVEDPKSYRPISLVCVPTRSSRGLYTLVLSRLLTHFSLGSRLDSDGEGKPWIRLFCLLKASRIHLRPRRRLLPCLSI